MTRSYVPAAPAATGGHETHFGGLRTTFRSIAIVMRVAQSLWPHKKAEELSLRTGVTPRACQYWLQRALGERLPDMSGDAFARLVFSDAGLAVIDEGMRQLAAAGGTVPDWYATWRDQVEMAALERDLRALRRRVKTLDSG